MQKLMNRFALLAVLGGLMASALVVGCSSPEETAPAGDPGNSTASPAPAP